MALISASCRYFASPYAARTRSCPSSPSYEEAAEIFGDMPALWERATADEQRSLLNPLVERVYIDIESQRIGAIAPTAGFRSLLEHAVRRTEHSRAVLLTAQETRQIMSGLELVETGES